MSRYSLRIAAAILSFAIGLFGVWASGYWKSFENNIVNWFAPANVEAISESKPILEIINEKESVLIYLAILESNALFRTGEQYVIEKNSTSEFLDLNEEIPFIKKTMPNVELNTLENFVSQNKQTGKLPDFSCHPSKCIFINKREQTSTGFGNHHFSKIGFNSTQTQALVYTGIWCGYKCGKGYYYRLSKRNNVWIIDEIQTAWVS